MFIIAITRAAQKAAAPFVRAVAALPACAVWMLERWIAANQDWYRLQEDSRAPGDMPPHIH